MRKAFWILTLLTFSIEFQIHGAEPVEEYRFKVEVLAVGMPQPLQLKLAPDGRIFFNELKGTLRIWKPDSQSVVEAGTVPTFADQENGLLGFALDPQFEKNHWIYLYYSPTNYTGQRLSRFVMNGDLLVPGSEKVMLEFGEQRRECCHHAGSVQFGPDGNIYISTGDNTHPFGDSESYGPMDERPGREPWDSQKGASNTADLRGKILRIRPTAEGGYTIPEGNLFPADGSAGRPEIFEMGCRNPWRMNVDQKTGIVYWGEVGPDAGGDGPRGSRGYDEINQARRPGNYGWPYFVGNNFPYAKYNYATKVLGAMFDPLRPVNDSPNNTGARILPPAQPAMIYWPYGKSKEFPELGEGGRTACAGQVFHYRPEFAKTGGFPEQYDNCLLFYDWQRPFMKWARLNEDAKLVRIEPFIANVAVVNDKQRINQAEKEGLFVIRRPEDSQFGSDGCLYLIDYGETWGPNSDSKLLKISYQRGNLAPTAVASAKPDAGREPLEISLSSSGSNDRDGDPLSFEWRLFPGDKVISTEANPKVTIKTPGNYVITLVVNDGHGGIAKSSAPLLVGNAPPRVRFLSPQDGDFFTPGKPLSYKLLIEDQEDGSSSAYEELMDARAFVSARWSQGAELEEIVEPGLAMMRQNDCFNCHSPNQKIVGPALLDIANRYRGQAGALDTSVQRVLKGSSGVWSPAPMLAHDRLSPDQVQLMVRWIYNLQPGKTGADLARGVAGTVAVPPEVLNRTGILEATYTDLGRAPAGPLAGKARVMLRNHRVEGEDGKELSGSEVHNADQASGKKFLRARNAIATARYAGLNLETINSVTCRIASPEAAGIIELHQNSATGDTLARLDVKPTGSSTNWIEVSSPIASVMSRCDVVVVLQSSGRTNWVNLDWMQFDSQTGR
jgi:cytochrome c